MLAVWCSRIGIGLKLSIADRAVRHVRQSGSAEADDIDVEAAIVCLVQVRSIVGGLRRSPSDGSEAVVSTADHDDVASPALTPRTGGASQGLVRRETQG